MIIMIIKIKILFYQNNKLEIINKRGLFIIYVKKSSLGEILADEPKFYGETSPTTTEGSSNFSCSKSESGPTEA